MRWYVLARTIWAPSSSRSRRVTAFTAPAVPTGMNTGVSIAPCGVVRVPARARPSRASIVKENAFMLDPHPIVDWPHDHAGQGRAALRRALGRARGEPALRGLGGPGPRRASRGPPRARGQGGPLAP